MTLDAQVRSMDTFLDAGSHAADIRGTISVEGVAAGAELVGTLSLFPDGKREAMRYEATFTADDGRPWRLSGVKIIRSREPVALVHALTHLRTVIAPLGAGDGESPDGAAPDRALPDQAPSDAPDGAIVTVLEIGARDLVGLGTSICGQAFTRARELRAAARFVGFFAASALRRR